MLRVRRAAAVTRQQDLLFLPQCRHTGFSRSGDGSNKLIIGQRLINGVTGIFNGFTDQFLHRRFPYK